MAAVAVLVLWITLFVSYVTSLVISSFPLAVSLWVVWLGVSYFMFRNTLNRLQVAGRIYWIVRDVAERTTPRVSRAFMRETDAPWRTGVGIQVRFSCRTIQIGWCDKGHSSDEIGGLVYAVGGRMLEDTPNKIGSWEH